MFILKAHQKEIVMSVRKLSREEIRRLIWEGVEGESKTKIKGVDLTSISRGKSPVDQGRISQSMTVVEKAIKRVFNSKPLKADASGVLRLSKDEIQVTSSSGFDDDFKVALETELERWVGALDLTRREALEVRFSIKIANI